MNGVRYDRVVDADYYGQERADVVAKLPRPLGRVLDVGCGSGGVGRALRRAGATELVGIEVHAESAERAKSVFDAVHVGDVASVVGDVRGPFDTIVLYDVLEHLVDPAAVLAALAPLAAPGSHVHVSVPNARHFSLTRDLVLRGTFGYTEWGHRDATHLRWFTRRDMEALLTEQGWVVVDASPAILGRGELVDRATFGLLRDFLALQWHVLARRP